MDVGAPSACEQDSEHDHADAQGIVTTVPSVQEIAALQQRFPGTVVRIEVNVGDRLSDLPNQDPYRYKLATLYIGAADYTSLEQRYQQCLESLRFEFDELDRP